jgi:DNA-nicking Smr family endonuclease
MKKLDLHGAPHEEVPDLVHQFINENWKPNLELNIITGHSDRMRSLVYDVLKQYDLEFVTTDLRNSGQIRVQTWHE